MGKHHTEKHPFHLSCIDQPKGRKERNEGGREGGRGGEGREEKGREEKGRENEGGRKEGKKGREGGRERGRDHHVDFLKKKKNYWYFDWITLNL